MVLSGIGCLGLIRCFVVFFGVVPILFFPLDIDISLDFYFDVQVLCFKRCLGLLRRIQFHLQFLSIDLDFKFNLEFDIYTFSHIQRTQQQLKKPSIRGLGLYTPQSVYNGFHDTLPPPLFPLSHPSSRPR